MIYYIRIDEKNRFIFNQSPVLCEHIKRKKESILYLLKRNIKNSITHNMHRFHLS